MKVCWGSNINGSIKELNDVDDTLPTIVENGDTSSTKKIENSYTFPTKVERHFSQRCWKQFDKDSSVIVSFTTITGGRCHRNYQVRFTE
jgi:hypothetical protein